MRNGKGSWEGVQAAKKVLRAEIRRARREAWEESLNRAIGEDVWAITRYPKPQKKAVPPLPTRK